MSPKLYLLSTYAFFIAAYIGNDSIGEFCFVCMSLSSILILLKKQSYLTLLRSKAACLILLSIFLSVILQMINERDIRGIIIPLSLVAGISFPLCTSKIKASRKVAIHFSLLILLTLTIIKFQSATIQDATSIYQRIVDENYITWKYFPIQLTFLSVFLSFFFVYIKSNKIKISTFFVVLVPTIFSFLILYSTLISISRVNIIASMITVISANGIALIRLRFLNKTALSRLVVSIIVFVLFILIFGSLFSQSNIGVRISNYIYALFEIRGGFIGDDQGTIGVRAMTYNSIFNLDSVNLGNFIFGYPSTDSMLSDGSLDSGFVAMTSYSGIISSLLYVSGFLWLLLPNIIFVISNILSYSSISKITSDEVHIKRSLSYSLGISLFVMFLLSGGWSSYWFYSVGILIGFLIYPKID